MRMLLLGVICAASPALAHEATINGATAQQEGGEWRIAVSLAHEETGWDDYADGWRVENEAGDTLGTRVLHHPHANEQPFTRSLSGVIVPDGTEAVWIRARTSADGWGNARYRLELPAE
ncbi:hypothetical protein [Aliiroseovarius sp. 2305UL8-7]|uniref:hypothetical protein n=1 Tax=Aliiroseovarius conchicola TaxID=3121637 RepID=UPI0035270C08